MNPIVYEKPNWFSIDKSKLLIDPMNNDYIKVHFTKKDVNIKTAIYKTNISPKIKYQPNPPFDYYKESLKLINNYESNVIKCIENNNSNAKLKTLKTKLNKKANSLNTVIRVEKYQLILNNQQKNKIQSWITECKKVYNKCVDKLKTDNTYFNKGYQTIKASLLNEIYEKIEKTCPYDVLSDEIRIFSSNLKSCFTNLKNHNIKYFEIKKKLKTHSNYSLLIPSKSVQANGIFKSLLGSIENFHLINLPTHDCRLFYNNKCNTYTLMIPVDVQCQFIVNREEIVAIDPGEKKFIEFFGLKSYGYIGKNIRKPLLKIRDKIKKYQKILYNYKTNRSGEKLRNRKHLKSKIRKLYRKSKNIVKELHNQSANYLCKNYDKIIIPKFETQQMVKHKKSSYKEYKLQYITKEGTTIERRNEQAKKLIKIQRLNKNVKYVLNALSHYSFRQHLTEKSVEHGCQLRVVTEEYTSCTCTNCGHKSTKYDKQREKECAYCHYKIDRDLNGARNILLKNLKAFNYEAMKPMGTYIPKQKNKVLIL